MGAKSQTLAVKLHLPLQLLPQSMGQPRVQLLLLLLLPLLRSLLPLLPLLLLLLLLPLQLHLRRLLLPRLR